MKAITFMLLLCTVAGVAKDKEETVWQSAKVIDQKWGSQEAGAYAGPVGNGTVAVPLYRNWNRILLQVTDDERWDVAEEGRSRLVVPVNGFVSFYREKGKLIIVDTNGKKHRFVIVGIKRKPVQ